MQTTTLRSPVLMLVLAACAGGPAASSTTDGSASGGSGESTSSASATVGGSASSTSKGSTSGDPTGTSSSSTGTSSTTDDPTDSSTGACLFIACIDAGTDCVVVPGLDGVPRCVECDPWEQNCPEGEKCVPWANDGGNSWNALRCSAAGDDQPGEPCTVEGSGVSGVDSCVVGAMCWDVDVDTLQGTCVGLCDGSPEAPTCAEPDTTCLVANDGVLSLCLPTCDPIAQDCPIDETCVEYNGDFHCVPLVEEPGAYGQPCEFISACNPGLACIDAAAVPGCMAAGCCSPFCKLSEPNTCPGMPEQSCVAYYEDPPEGYEDLGVCAIPP